MTDKSNNLTLVTYVAFADFGEKPVELFLQSYVDHAAGRPHRLLIACKNYGKSLPKFDVLGAPADSLVVQVPNSGFDLGTYRHVAENFIAPRYCFFNSRSRLLAAGWLSRLEDALTLPGVAVAGTTGSRQSLLTDHLDIHRHASGGSIVRRLVRRSPINTFRHWWRFAPFPNPHLRTNALLVERDLMLKLWKKSFRSKLSTAEFENGRNSLTRRVQALGLRTVVVGRHGVFDENDWGTSETFWNHTQANLLVADNQTDRYNTADVAERQALSALAWQDEAHFAHNNGNIS